MGENGIFTGIRSLLFLPVRTMIRGIEKRMQGERGGKDDGDFISGSDVFGGSCQRSGELGARIRNGMVICGSAKQAADQRLRLRSSFIKTETAVDAQAAAVIQPAEFTGSDE